MLGSETHSCTKQLLRTLTEEDLGCFVTTEAVPETHSYSSPGVDNSFELTFRCPVILSLGQEAEAKLLQESYAKEARQGFNQPRLRCRDASRLLDALNGAKA